MLSAIDLNDQSSGGAVEIDDVRSDLVLPPESNPELIMAEQSPELAFCIGGLAAQPLPAFTPNRLLFGRAHYAEVPSPLPSP